MASGVFPFDIYGISGNDRYLKFINGTMIQWGYFAITPSASDWSSWAGGYMAEINPNHNFAQAFVGAVPTVMMMNSAGGIASVLKVQRSITAIGTMNLFRNSDYSSSMTFAYIAIGRWK